MQRFVPIVLLFRDQLAALLAENFASLAIELEVVDLAAGKFVFDRVFKFDDLFSGARELRLPFGGRGRLAGTLGVVADEPQNLVVAAVRFDAVKERQQRVIVALQKRIDLVIVAASAIRRQAEKRLRRRRQDVVQPVEERQLAIGRLIVPQAEPVISGRDDPVGSDLIEFIAGQLLTNELVVRLVVVERADDVVAITPDERLGIVPLEAVRLGVANQVEPMSSPMLAVVPRIEQPIDDLLVGVRRRVRRKLFDILRRRRQAGQRVKQSPQQRLFRGCWRGSHAVGFELREHERVDRICDLRFEI